MAPKSKLRLSPDSYSPPRNSFTATDYYRDTRDEYYSPISKLASLSVRFTILFDAHLRLRCSQTVHMRRRRRASYVTRPGVRDSSLTPSQMYIPEDYSDKGGTEEATQQRVGKRAAAFWVCLFVYLDLRPEDVPQHIFHALFCKWRCQKERIAKSRAAQR
jgi:hypothetical protein